MNKLTVAVGVILLYGMTGPRLSGQTIFAFDAERLEEGKRVAAECEKQTGTKPWLVLQRYAMEAGTLLHIALLPPDRQTPELRRGKAFCLETRMNEYAQVASPFAPFDKQFSLPEWRDVPFLVKGCFTDEELVSIYDSLRGHMMNPNSHEAIVLDAAREADDDARRSIYTSATQHVGKLQSQEVSAIWAPYVSAQRNLRRIETYLAPLSSADGYTLRNETIACVSHTNWSAAIYSGAHDHKLSGTVVVTTTAYAGTGSGGQYLYLHRNTNNVWSIVASGGYVQ